MTRTGWRLMALGALLMMGAAQSAAQGPDGLTPNYPFSSFRFNFIYPGSRATGMGQAFIALGDDATGSETNPAGLTALVTPQLFIEGRLVDNTFEVLAPSATDIRYQELDHRLFSPTFVSVVYPFRNWAFGAYRQELANYYVSPDPQTMTIPGVNVIYFNPDNPQPLQVLEFQSDIDIEAVNYGFSAAGRWGQRFNFGISIRRTQLSLKTLETRATELLEPYVRFPEGDTRAVISRIEGDDWAWSWVGGFILKPLDWLKLAGVYRSGSTHRFQAIFYENYLTPLGEPMRQDIPEFEINIPDRYGLGLAVMPTEQITLTLDVLRVEYGDMTHQFIEYIQTEFQDDYGYENGNELHLGGEYTFFIRQTPVSLRGGYYTDADNTLHFLGDRGRNDLIHLAPGLDVPADEFFDDFPRAQAALFPKGDTDHHVTFGIGLTLKGHLQTDFACDFSRDTDYVVFSVLYNF